MGGAESLGGMHVDLETPNVVTGGEVTGTIHLLVKEPTRAQTLEIILKGKEYTQWTTRQNKQDVTHRGHHVFLQAQIPVYVFANGELPAGQYSFPYTVVVPQNIPSTFSYGEEGILLLSHPVIAKISYKLVARVTGENARIDKGRADLSVKRPLSELVIPMSHIKAARLRTWCCFDQGVVKIKANVDRSAYHPGETATVSLNVDNREGKLRGTGFRVSLVRTILMQSDYGSRKSITSVVSSNLINEQLVSGQSMSSDDLKTIQIPIPNDDSLKFLSTVTGFLIQCEYKVKGEFVVDGCCMCCGDDAAAESVVNIHPANIDKKQTPTLAELWKPMVMPKLSGILHLADKPVPSAPSS